MKQGSREAGGGAEGEHDGLGADLVGGQDLRLGGVGLDTLAVPASYLLERARRMGGRLERLRLARRRSGARRNGAGRLGRGGQLDGG